MLAISGTDTFGSLVHCSKSDTTKQITTCQAYPVQQIKQLLSQSVSQSINQSEIFRVARIA